MKTATEFFDEGNFNNVTDILIEFAKMHVEEALKQASEKSFVEYIEVYTIKDSILNAYPLDLIK